MAKTTNKVAKRAVTGEVVRGRGQPTTFTQDIANEICRRLAEGQSMRSICRDENMPPLATVFGWLATRTDFSEQYARAKQESADAMVEDMLYLADHVDQDNPFAVNKARLQVDTRKWIASKLKPKKYGDKVDLTTNGKDLPSPLLGGITAQSE